MESSQREADERGRKQGKRKACNTPFITLRRRRKRRRITENIKHSQAKGGGVLKSKGGPSPGTISFFHGILVAISVSYDLDVGSWAVTLPKELSLNINASSCKVQKHFNIL